MNIKITGSGSYIPSQIMTNQDFSNHHFLNDDGTDFVHSNEVVAAKFK
jgi:3-oxoacyl-[acyl-carrier-protein] synthase-3